LNWYAAATSLPKASKERHDEADRYQPSDDRIGAHLSDSAASCASLSTVQCYASLSVVLGILGVIPVACGFGLDNATTTDCSFTNVDVGEDQTTGACDYQFDLIDGAIGHCNMHVQGTYNPSTRLADEQLTGNGSRVHAIWIC
jgi:hypothetical protein